VHPDQGHRPSKACVAAINDLTAALHALNQENSKLTDDLDSISKAAGQQDLAGLDNAAEQASVDVSDANQQVNPDAYEADATACFAGR
jgi:hypothetical protein